MPLEAGGDGVFVPESAKTLRVDTRSDLVIAGVTGVLTVFSVAVVIGRLPSAMLAVWVGK